MLTGDENIINVQFTVQYRINDLEGYLYNLTEPESTVRAASESAMREVIGDTKVMDALTVGKSLIETATANTCAVVNAQGGQCDQAGAAALQRRWQGVR